MQAEQLKPAWQRKTRQQPITQDPDSDNEEQRAYRRDVHAAVHDDSSIVHGPPDDEHDKPGLFRKIKDRLTSEKRMVANLFNMDHEIEEDIKSVDVHPEIKRQAHVRRGPDLCNEEAQSLRRRRAAIAPHLRAYLGLEEEIQPEDVPILGLGGSGGGFRAMLGLLATMQEMQKGGEWDLLAFVAGVSGSCWAIAAFYTWGQLDCARVLHHFGRHSKHHPLSPHAIHSVLRSIDGPARTLGPITAKALAGCETRLMDLYGAFLTSWFWLPSRDETQTKEDRKRGIKPEYLKWSNAATHVETGEQPIPLLTAIRHERPWEDWHSSEQPFKSTDHKDKEHKEARAWWQWFEFSPFESGGEELAWCPTWAFGRKFDGQSSSEQELPEHSLGLVLGLCTSAPAGPLSAYLGTLQRNLPHGFVANTVNGISERIARHWGPVGVDQFVNHHPLHASSVHNFARQEGQNGIQGSAFLELIDSGLDNNTPLLTLARNARDVDVLITFDASSDVQKGTFGDEDGPLGQFGRRKGLGFTRRDLPASVSNDTKWPDPASQNIADNFRGKYAQLFDGVPCSTDHSHGVPPAIRSTTVLYLPLLPHASQPDYDPSAAKFSGSYNLCWSQEQVDTITRTANANWDEARATFKLLLREAYEKRKAARLSLQREGMKA